MLAHCPAYTASPFTTLRYEGQEVLIKDETRRMGLGAFKALGGTYAVAHLLAERMPNPNAVDQLLSEETRAIASGMTFVSASAGNHGMAVAAGASLFGAKSRIHLAQTVPEDFVSRLRRKGAEVVRSGENYEQSLDAAIADAETTGGIHLADGTWPGYIERGRLVMEGYTVIAEEMRKTLESTGEWPDRVYLQAGVGGLAGSVAYMIRQNWTVQPEIVVVEPTYAPCLAQSVQAGEIVTVEGSQGNMGRLDCKTPSLIPFEILKTAADRFIAITDKQAARAAEIAAEMGIQTTPSGVAGLAAMLDDTEKASRPLVVISEGASDGS